MESQARQEWLKGLIENGITSDLQINAGLSKCRAHNSPYLPSIGQFIEWCRVAAQDAQGLPSESEAMSAVVRELGRPKELRQWGNHHPSVFMAYSQRQSYDWKNYNYTDLKKAFSETWDQIKKIANTGFDFSSALPKPEDVRAPVTAGPIDRESGAKKTAEILSMFGVDAKKSFENVEHCKDRLRQAREILKTRDSEISDELTNRDWAK